MIHKLCTYLACIISLWWKAFGLFLWIGFMMVQIKSWNLKSCLSQIELEGSLWHLPLSMPLIAMLKKQGEDRSFDKVETFNAQIYLSYVIVSIKEFKRRHNFQRYHVPSCLAFSICLANECSIEGVVLGDNKLEEYLHHPLTLYRHLIIRYLLFGLMTSPERICLASVLMYQMEYMCCNEGPPKAKNGKG